MRAFFGRSRRGCVAEPVPARPRVRLYAVGLALAVFYGAALPSAGSADWPRLTIGNQLTHHSVRLALANATVWLSSDSCRGLFSEFRDENGNPLSDRLVPLGVSEAEYLKLLVFRDGSLTRQCERPTTVMFTAQGHRVVFVCDRPVESMRRTDPPMLSAMVIHEALHSLGLGENPPSSAFITERVLDRCRR